MKSFWLLQDTNSNLAEADLVPLNTFHMYSHVRSDTAVRAMSKIIVESTCCHDAEWVDFILTLEVYKSHDYRRWHSIMRCRRHHALFPDAPPDSRWCSPCVTLSYFSHRLRFESKFWNSDLFVFKRNLLIDSSLTTPCKDVNQHEWRQILPKWRNTYKCPRFNCCWKHGTHFCGLMQCRNCVLSFSARSCFASSTFVVKFWLKMLMDHFVFLGRGTSWTNWWTNRSNKLHL